uniref:RING-type domain-containing protein n=1 Tax=Globodera pallida TaxID=36090 RepID=A0A183CF51_GLOPA
MRAFGAMEKATRARQCPRCLNIYAQKIGCNYVRCPNLRCNTWFCWECGKKDVDWTHFMGDCKPSFDDVLKGLYVVKFVLFIGGFTTLFITPSVFLGLFVFAPLSITLGTPPYALHRIMKKWDRRESDQQEVDVARKALFGAIYIVLFIALLPLGAALAVVAMLPITLFWFIYLALLWIKLIPIFGQVTLLSV